MKQFTVTGMSCAACSARVEKVAGAVKGVNSCNVNLLSGLLSVDGTAKDKDIISAVEKAGFGISSISDSEDNGKKKENSRFLSLTKSIIASAFFLVPLMYLSMGKMFSFPQPDYKLSAAIQAILSFIIIVINKRFFISGVNGVINKAPNMDTLVSLGSGCGYIFSLYNLYRLFSGKTDISFYFDSSAMILILIGIGKALETNSKKKTVTAVNSLLELSPKTAFLYENGEEKEIDLKEVKLDDILALHPGDSVPVDGMIIHGSSCLDEKMLTGESFPCDKSIGDRVFAGTVNKTGYVRIKAAAIGEETALSNIIKLVNQASSTKAPIAKIADRVSGIFVPTIVIISLITLSALIFTGASFSDALQRAISVLVISCPCSLGLATPVAITVGSGFAAKKGILFKNAASLENTGKVKNIIFDKTGTITTGNPKVTVCLPICSEYDELLNYALTVEEKSKHPLAMAITSFCRENNAVSYECSDFSEIPGTGTICSIGISRLLSMNLEKAQKLVDIPNEILLETDYRRKMGETPICFVKDNQCLGVIFTFDEIKNAAADCVNALKKMGIESHLLSGDNQTTVSAVSEKINIKKFKAEVLPQNKQEYVSEVKKQGFTIMVGDGINDSPALVCADIGIAVGNGTDVAIESADVILINNDIASVTSAIKISKKVNRIIKQNLFWAFFYNCLAIPIAAGALTVFGISLSPMIAAACMSLSSLCVVSNSLRINHGE